MRSIERAPTAPGTLKNKIGEMLLSSINVTAKVEGLNQETGEYRIILQGCLDREESKFDEA